METKNWIGGEWSEPAAGVIEVRNPSDVAETVGIIHLSGRAELLSAVDAARRSQPKWAAMTGAERGECLYRMANLLELHSSELANLASSEMGKPIAEMRGEVARGVNLLRYYAGEGVRANGQMIPSSQSHVKQYSVRVPVGVAAIVTPWNFPVAIPIWKIAPALICGNAVVWKPAEHACLTAVKMAEIWSAARLPEGTVNLIIGKGSVIGNALLEEARIDAISFTGSTGTGLRVAAASAARNLKFQTEMGGKNAAVVLRDADLDIAVPAIVSGAFRSAGQKCTATSRIIVDRTIYDEFAERIAKATSNLRMANARDERAFLGPVASKEQFKSVNQYVDTALSEARTVAIAPEAEGNGEGYYIRPLLVEGVSADHALVQEEVFGPLAVILPADNTDEAIELVNRTVFGLSASVFTKNLSDAFRFLEEAEAGMVRVNQETGGVEYQAPFGGMKSSSSHTREQGQSALEFYTHLKTCSIQYR
ncbi:aldehyde dehydrogenase family protein [Cohnella endophytica]|uniref:Aldehyde dehydrogenase family protein n=1 Tax=Cohnella endophytica TaxID=2419778 RepID=A0A494XYJ0_9BACL|nr:aldehyde dehydrogenase family protein [Cohnella endophytica]RKP54099.1 aldehyde dehydrogenase family protein [Cohnella endophytica]